MKRCVLLISILLLICGSSWADESDLSISDPAVAPNTVTGGNLVLISCGVQHAAGPASIKRVAALVTYDEVVASFPDLFDDGTNGDEVPEDGIYSRLIPVMDNPGVAQITFTAVDIENNELDSATVPLNVQ